jgi:hypothetical protein
VHRAELHSAQKIGRKTAPTDRRKPAPAPSPSTAWVADLQRLAGNRAVVAALQQQPVVQRAEPAAAPVTSGSRVPTQSEWREWGDYFYDIDFRMVRDPEDGYNCFAWAVGSTSGPITYPMLADAGFGPDVTGFTGYLETTHGFGRHADGLHASADLILYGETPSMVLHAARKADEPFEALTFSSKLGGDTDKTPVILHAPAAVQGRSYGTALRSFWKGPAAPEEAPAEKRRFRLFPGLFSGRK